MLDSRKKCRYWLNPHYAKSDTENSTRCDAMPSKKTKSHKGRFHQKNPHWGLANKSTRSGTSGRTLGGILLNKISTKCWKFFSHIPLPSVSSTLKPRREAREVVMEGVMPTSKESLMNFLKGMGLHPTVEYVGSETLISADLSDIRNTDIKAKFLNLMRRQVISTESGNFQSSLSSSTPSRADSKKVKGSSNTKQLQNHEDEHKDQHENEHEDEHEDELSRPSQDSHRQSDDSSSSSGDSSSNGSASSHRRQAVNQAHIVRRSRNAKKTDLYLSSEEIHFLKDERDHPSRDERFHSTTKEEISHCSRKTHSADHPPRRAHPIPPVPWQNVLTDSDPRNVDADLSGFSRDEGRKLSALQGPRTVMNQERDEIMMIDPFNLERRQAMEQYLGTHGISNAEWYYQNPILPECSASRQAREGKREVNKSNEETKKDQKQFKKVSNLKKLSSSLKKAAKKKMQKNMKIMKHFGGCFERKKKVKTSGESNENSFEVADESKNAESSNSNSGTGIMVGRRVCVDCQPRAVENEEIRKIKASKKNIKPEEYDGSISMPVLIEPDKSLFKVRPEEAVVETSKSSTKAGHKSHNGHLKEDQGTFSVVGDSAAIHIDKKRIRLEGKDVKYGSILHKDPDFDKPFKVLKENTCQDIERQVKKVKERITFARAMDAVNDHSLDQPTVDLKDLLLPTQSSDRSRTKKELEVVTSTSFYQKFLASMNIMKSTVRSDACDRSVMTDEPLSRTYAEFLAATATVSDKGDYHRQLLNIRSQSITNGMAQGWDRLPISDSVSEFMPSGPVGYVTRMCQCWEPLLTTFKRDFWSNGDKKLGKGESSKVDEERILRAVVNKVIESSRKRKGYIKTDISP